MCPQVLAWKAHVAAQQQARAAPSRHQVLLRSTDGLHSCCPAAPMPLALPQLLSLAPRP